MIENFFAAFSSLVFSFRVVAIISVPTPFKRLCNFLLYFSCRKNAVVTTENFIPSIFMAKNKVFERLKSKEFTECSNFCEGVTNKNKTGKGR